MNENITVSKNQLIISSFKPKVVEMHSRVDLDKFQEGAMATGVGLHWHEWRFSVEVGGKLYTKLVESGDITSDQHTHLKNFILDSQKNKDVVKKEKVVENVGDADRKVLLEQLASIAKALGATVSIAAPSAPSFPMDLTEEKGVPLSPSSSSSPLLLPPLVLLLLLHLFLVPRAPQFPRVLRVLHRVLLRAPRQPQLLVP